MSSGAASKGNNDCARPEKTAFFNGFLFVAHADTIIWADLGDMKNGAPIR